MAAAPPDRSDPGVRADLRLAATERTQRASRITAAIALFALAAVIPFVAQPLTGDPGAIYGATIASIVLVGCGVAAWPWRWSDAEREQHTFAAIWDEARVDADRPNPVDAIRGLGTGPKATALTSSCSPARAQRRTNASSARSRRS